MEDRCEKELPSTRSAPPESQRYWIPILVLQARESCALLDMSLDASFSGIDGEEASPLFLQTSVVAEKPNRQTNSVRRASNQTGENNAAERT